jgi:hypothetical protein
MSLAAADQPPDPPLSDTRLTVHTLLREDIFAGFLKDDLDRMTRGEKNIEILLQQRPKDKPSLLGWKAGATLYRAARALDAGRNQEFEEKYAQVTDLLAEARKAGPKDLNLSAITGGIYVVMADRLPEKFRGEAWAKAYESYQELWKAQAPVVTQLPLHLKGELFGGIAQSAQRTGRTKEAEEFLDKIIAALPDTAYANAAKRWKKDPKAAKDLGLTCLTCHSPGRLAARRAALGDK